MNSVSNDRATLSFIPSLFVKRFSHPWMPSLLHGSLGLGIFFLCLRARPDLLISNVLLVFAGMFLWTLIEYFLHRFVFHWVKVKQPWRDLASGLHMAHHRTVDTEDLILAPPLTSLTFGAIIYLILLAFTWNFAFAGLLETGIFFGYIVYEWAHYSSHRYHPRSGLGKYLKHYHLQHHFKDPHRTFGVTSPLWDFVFGTHGSKNPNQARS